MDREQVLMAVGQPASKVRYTKDDVDFEDWIYGHPPGVIQFVKFAGAKVKEIEEHYGGIGGSVAAADNGKIK
jgi:hypothetical protein